MKKMMIFISMILTLCSCSNNSSIVFKGESKNWSSTYTIENPNGEHHNEILKIKYKGKNRKDVTGIKYSYKDAVGAGGSGEHPRLSIDGVITSKSGGNGALPPKDSIVHVTVEWNENKEELQLTSK
ncbi:MAG: hypothetical protein E6Y08_19340 [Paenibacillus sp.]|uniref:hypothetical protein n=1 Tax=Paenibacillus sp. TaxID=58172 RepID=UPI00290A85F3|nr:hypothetical protein [Paenibacillus sp.]MDU4697969.1 hypothetical protein [Paenibacillus sp.]